MLSTGHVECWGANEFGQLGDGSTTNAHTPVEVHGITNATEVVAGRYHACAVLSSGRVDCWGEDNFGQLGDGTSSGPETCVIVYPGKGRKQEPERIEYSCSMVPVEVQGITDATEASAGFSYSCALLSTGSADCWGASESGELGDGALSAPDTCYTAREHTAAPCSTVPLEVQGLTSATQLSSGGFHSCALLPTGQVACWGYNGDGQLGDGIPEDCMGPPREEACSTTPVEAEGVTDATEVAAGAYHSCAVLTTGHVDCWGSDGVGELGDDGPWSDVPRKVQGILAPPAAVTGRAGTVTNTSATVSATAYPGGVEVSGCEFEYGTTRSYGSSVPCSSPPGVR